MKLLLIYNEVPDNVYFYIIPLSELKDEWHEHIINAHNKLINCHPSSVSMDWLSSALSSKPEHCLNPANPDNCCLFKYKVQAEDVPLGGPYSRVYYSGFIL